MIKDEMIKIAEMWQKEADRKDLATGYRTMAKRQAKAWRDKTDNPALYDLYREFQDRMNQEVRF